MSFCRFNHRRMAHPSMPPSDLYVFAHVDGGFCCMLCPLSYTGNDFRCATATEMVEHVQAHRAAGHHVWDGVEEEILQDHLWNPADEAILAPAVAAGVQVIVSEDRGFDGKAIKRISTADLLGILTEPKQ